MNVYLQKIVFRIPNSLLLRECRLEKPESTQEPIGTRDDTPSKFVHQQRRDGADFNGICLGSVNFLLVKVSTWHLKGEPKTELRKFRELLHCTRTAQTREVHQRRTCTGAAGFRHGAQRINVSNLFSLLVFNVW